jgi:putative transposase
MPRRLRFATGGFVYHALNRAVARAALFETPADFDAFEKVLLEAKDWRPVRLLGWCVMPNHWHLVLWPRADGDLSEFLRWLSVTHSRRWHSHHRTAGTGALYQGRFKSFPVQQDEHLLAVLRYVERNPLRAGLVERAEQWRWSSLRHRGGAEQSAGLDAGPVALPGDWRQWVNGAETAGELEALRRSSARGAPFGEAGWQRRTAELLGLQSTLRRRGRPPKAQTTGP